MTLDVLSTTQHSDPSVKGGGRSARSGGSSDDFSGTLSKLDRDGGAGEKGGRGNGDATTVEDASLPSENAGSRAGVRAYAASVMTMEGELDSGAQNRVSITEVFGTAKGKGEASSAGEKLKEAGGWPVSDGSEEVEADPTAQGKEKQPPKTATGDEATDLLAMLAGQTGQGNSDAVGMDVRRMTDGRKSSGAHGRDVAQTSGAGLNADPSDTLDLPTDDIDRERRPLRFINARNGSLNGEMMAAANGRERAVEGKAGSAGADSVVVLDSRRFLGLVGNSNSASLLASMVADPEWSTSMQAGSTQSSLANGTATGSTVHMLKLQMNPHNLGMVTATLRLVGEELHVHLTVETRAAHRQLSADSAGMLDALKSQGFSVDQVTINIASNTDTSSQKGQQDTQMGQQMAGNGERNSDAPKEQSTRFASAMNGDADAGGEWGSDDRAPGGPVGARSGNLYL